MFSSINNVYLCFFHRLDLRLYVACWLINVNCENLAEIVIPSTAVKTIRMRKAIKVRRLPGPCVRADFIKVPKVFHESHIKLIEWIWTEFKMNVVSFASFSLSCNATIISSAVSSHCFGAFPISGRSCFVRGGRGASAMMRPEFIIVK